MTTASLDPNATRSGSGAFTISGSVSPISAALADTSDATFVSRTSLTQRGDFVVDMGTYSLSASQGIGSVTVALRSLRPTADSKVYVRQGYLTDAAAGTVRYASPDQFVAATSSIQTQLGVARIVAPDGQPWDQTRLNNLVLRVTDYATASAARSNMYKLLVEVDLNDRPSASITSPTGTITNTSRPAIAWIYTDADNDPQTVYESRVFSSTQYGVTGFDPATSVATWESGLVTSADSGVSVPIDLDNSASFRAYVRVGHPLSSSVFLSDWTYSQFYINYLSSPKPKVTAQFSEYDNAVFVTATGGTNYLSDDDASLTTSVGTWVVISGANVTRSTAQSDDGVASLSLAATSTVASMSAQTGRYPIATDGQDIAATAKFRADANGRACTLSIRWFDSSNNFISATNATSVNDVNTGWVSASVVATPPSGATQAAVGVSIANPVAAEIHYVDRISLNNGETAVWSPGGLLSGQQIIAERSLDDGITWSELDTVDAYAPEQVAQFDDYTAPRDSTVSYRARVLAVSGQDELASPNSDVAAAFVTNDGKWWIKAIGAPEYNISNVRVRGPITNTTEQNIGVFRPLGRNTPVVVSGEVYGQDGEYRITFLTDAEWESGKTLFYDWSGDILVQDPSGDQKLIRVTARNVEHSISFDRPMRDLAVSYVQVG